MTIRSLAVIPLITNLLGAGSYGIWVTIFAVISLVSWTGEMHLHGSLIRYSSREEQKNQTYSDILFLIAVIAAVLSFVFVLIGMFVDISTLIDEGVDSQSTLIALAGLLIFSTMFFNINVNFPRAKGQVKAYEMLKTSKYAIESVVLIVVFLVGGDIVAGLLSLLAISVFLNLSIMGTVFVKLPLPLPDPSNFGRYIRYGAPMTPKALSTQLLTNTDKYLLLAFLGPSAVGIYAVAQAVSRPLNKFITVFNPTLYPTISEAWDKEKFSDIEEVYSTIFRLYAVIGIPAVVGIIILADPIMILLSTPSIAQEGIILVPIFIIGYYLQGLYSTLEYLLTSAERTDAIGGIVVTTVITNILLNLFLIPQLGMAGAAIATTFSYALSFGLVLYYVSSKISLKFPWASILRSSVGAFSMGIILFIALPDLGPYLTLIVTPIVGASIYFSLVLFLGEFTTTEINRVKSLLENTI